MMAGSTLSLDFFEGSAGARRPRVLEVAENRCRPGNIATSRAAEKEGTVQLQRRRSRRSNSNGNSNSNNHGP